eukprot:jgi/Chlat1/2351/Chrsp17S02617
MTMVSPAQEDQEERMDESMADVMPEIHVDPANGPESMEVIPHISVDGIPTVENKPASADDALSLTFTWTVENVSKIREKKHYSEAFTVGGFKWKILIFPRGNNAESLSLYLDVADSAMQPPGWSRSASFTLAVVNQFDAKMTVRKDTQHTFNARESDWGFTQFLPLVELQDPQRGYLVNDTLIIEAVVQVRKFPDYTAYESKKETGYVGLKNQGATCYMNSLLQTLYHIPYFRKAVYHMPTTEVDAPSSSIPLALQALFYKLQYTDTSVTTKDLTKSFGWDTYDAFMQHDVQELNRVLCEKLEDKMKSTVVEGTIQKLFEGHAMNFIECINVDYKSERKESFYDLQLDVKNCKDVYESFDKYVEVEKLDGDNKYEAEGFGLQDARKGVLFLDFPPVLQLQLKRFEYDFVRDTMVKINDRYEFPLQLDLDRYDGKYLAPSADRSVRNLYSLHSVLVHSGGVHGGHYYAYIRPTLGDQWLKFDDERVTKEDGKKALDEQFGGEEEVPPAQPGLNAPAYKWTKYSNAYMLVYIRDSDKDKVICPVTDKDIAEHLQIRLKKEHEEKERKRKEKSEAHLYTIIKVAQDSDLERQIGTDIFFDLIDHEKVKQFRVQKQTPFSQFKELAAQELGVPVSQQRWWLWAKRQNHTYRPNRPLTPADEDKPVSMLKEVSSKAQVADLRLFLETPLMGSPDAPLTLPEKGRDDILLFFKFYDPDHRELRYVGRYFAKLSYRLNDIKPIMAQAAGLVPTDDIFAYEEIKFEPNVMCESIETKQTLKACQLEDGDIICFQKALLPGEAETHRFPYVPQFLEYVRNRQVVNFRRLEKPKEDEFALELSKQDTYDDVVEKLAQELKLPDPSKIRLTAYNCYSHAPKPNPIKYRGVDRLMDMLVHYNQTSDVLYYEVLDIPLPELERLKTLKIVYHSGKNEEVNKQGQVLNIWLPKESTVGDVIAELKTKVDCRPDAELRILEVFHNRIFKVFPHHEKIENINDQYWTLRAEEIPEDEKNMGPNDRLIHVYHFTKDPAHTSMLQNFGDPFFLCVHENETVAEVRERIQAKLGVAAEEFAKYKLAFVSLGKVEYANDSDIVAAKFQQRRDQYSAFENYLGLEHADVGPKRPHAYQQSNRYEKAVKIYN